MQLIPAANFYAGGQFTGTAEAIALFVILAPMEVQILVPAVWSVTALQ